jgi:hypothetical protein
MKKTRATPTPPPVNRCAATGKGGKPCKARPITGQALCAMHDPTRGPSLRQAGVEARTARQAPLTPAEADELVRLETPADLPGTLQRIGRAVVSGRIDARLGHLLLLATASALRAFDAAEAATVAAEKRQVQADARVRAAEWAASPMGKLEQATNAAWNNEMTQMMSSVMTGGR